MDTSKNAQKNIFLTASPFLITEIEKKYDELKKVISKAHDHDYSHRVVASERLSSQELIKKFMDRLDDVNESFGKKKFVNFMEEKSFPCFLTIRDYIESIDAVLEKPFFKINATKSKN